MHLVIQFFYFFVRQKAKFKQIRLRQNNIIDQAKLGKFYIHYSIQVQDILIFIHVLDDHFLI